MYDICIIGAGPAGSTLARLLPSSYRVLLVDRRPMERPFAEGDPAKPCGGLLAPRAQAELARQGLGLPQSVVSGPQLFAVRTLDLVAGLERHYQRFYINVDREAFDRWLLGLVPDNVDVACGWRAESIDPADDGPMVRFSTPGGGKASIRARLLVGADGASSLVRRVLEAPRTSAPRYVAIQSRCLASAAEPHYGAVFDERITPFYGWTIPKGDSLLIGAAFDRSRDVVGAFERFMQSVHDAGFSFGLELSRESAPLVRPASPSHVVLGSGPIALAGEAAGLISPSSAEGISFALRSGAVLAGACEAGLEGVLPRYRRASAPLLASVSGKLMKSSAIYSPGSRRLIMRTGFGSLPMTRESVALRDGRVAW